MPTKAFRPTQKLGQLFLLLTVLFSYFSSTAHAQFERFDPGRLIETMRDKRMNDLLLHYADTAKLDKVDAAAIQVSIHRAKGDNPRLPADARKVEYEKSLELLKKLVDDKALRDHPKRPLWQAEYAEISFYKLFFLKASHLYAEFGVPDAEQKKEFQKHVLEAYLMLNEAELHIFRLRTSLPGREDYLVKYQSTGLADRILNEYGEMRIPFMNGVAHYYMALFPSWHPYFKKKYPQIPRKMDTHKGEVGRLLKGAISKMDTILETPDLNEQLKHMANAIKGRAYMRLGKAPQGQSILTEAAQGSEMGGLSRLEAQLGIVYGLGVVAKRTQPAIRILKPLYQYPLVKPSQPFQVLLSDLENKVLMKVAGNDPAKIAAAFKPYERLIKTDPAIGGFLNQRWADQVKKPEDILKLPPMAALGVGELKLGQAQDDNDADGMAEAEKIFAQVLKSKSASPAVKARAMHRQSLSIYLVNRNDLKRISKAVALMIETGRKFPKEKIALTAISEGVGMLPNIIENNKPADVKELRKLYAKGMEVVLANFPSSKIAKQQRVYYCEKFLFAQRKFKECAEVLADLDESEPQYFAGLRLLLESKVALLAEAENAGNTTERNALQAEVTLLVQTIKMKTRNDKSQIAQYLLAGALLTDAEMSMRLTQYLVALDKLKGIEQQVNVTQFPDVLAKTVRLRVTAAGYMGKSAQAKAYIQQLFNEFPSEAGAVTHNMLQDFITEIEEMDALIATLGSRSSAALKTKDKIKSLASVGGVLCQFLLDWVRNNKAQFPPQQANNMLLGYQLALAKLMIQSDQAKAAIQIVKEAKQAHGKDANVIFHYAEVFYFAGKADKAKAAQYFADAKREYSYLAKNLDPEFVTGVKGTPLEKIWWHSWLRFLQIMLEENKPDQKTRIPGLIKRLQAQDDEMGGFRKMFMDVQKRA